jgi:hypothetical protein
MRKLTDYVAAVAARSAVIALEAAWLAVLFAATVAMLGGGDASTPLRLAAAFGLVCALCAAAGAVALLGRPRSRR